LGNYISGTRYGFYQLGLYTLNGGMEYILSKVENQHIFRSDVPGPQPKPAMITSTSDIDYGIGGDYHTLVRLEDCYFEDANGSAKYFEPSGSLTTISRNIKFINGSGTVQARISKFCDFANHFLPQGTLKVTGLLTMFGTSSDQNPIPQLIIRSINDVEIVPPAKILENFDMKTNPFDIGWKNEQKTGDVPWTYSNESVGVQTPTNENECWLVSPKFNFAGEKNVALSFSYRMNTGTSDNLQVFYTTDGTNWESFGFFPQPGATKEVLLKLADHIATNPNLQIKFKYKTTTVFPMCAIYNITFLANVAQ
jgi:hypothetical protein